MADEADIAFEETEMFIKSSLSRHKQRLAPTEFCVNCNAAIRLDRQRAIVTDLCITCAEAKYQKEKQYAKFR